jgi:hypothetical protein
VLAAEASSPWNSPVLPNPLDSIQGRQPAEQYGHVISAMSEQRRCRHHHIGAGKQVGGHVISGFHAGAGGERGAHLTAQPGDPGPR